MCRRAYSETPELNARHLVAPLSPPPSAEKNVPNLPIGLLFLTFDERSDSSVLTKIFQQIRTCQVLAESVQQEINH